MLETLALVGVVALYFVPTFVSANRQHGAAIFALNALLGWTLVGWVVALVWALTSPRRPKA